MGHALTDALKRSELIAVASLLLGDRKSKRGSPRRHSNDGEQVANAGLHTRGHTGISGAMFHVKQ